MRKACIILVVHLSLKNVLRCCYNNLLQLLINDEVNNDLHF